jgi:leucyl aminopeptidase
MLDCLVTRKTAQTISLTPLSTDTLEGWLKRQGKVKADWVRAAGFTAKPGTTLPVPGDAKGKAGAIGETLVGVRGADDIWSWAGAATGLPAGRYALDESAKTHATSAALGWALGCYRFTRYKDAQNELPDLVWPAAADRDAVTRTATSFYLVRDLINTPAADMGPGELASTAKALAREFKAKCSVIVGDDLLRKNFPLIHAVGRASSRAPRLVDLTWGAARAPKVTLVGKGVCFDTGGLDLKPSSGMLNMKKDMGGAAHVLGLARMIMMAKLPVRLRVLIPAVENSVSGDALRPLDIVRARSGTTVEIGNTDAEGRLVLADALTEAISEKPALILDFATLTGAARVAMGPELPAMFVNDDSLAADLLRGGEAEGDPVWRMPLWRDYRRFLDSDIADINNTSSTPQGGAITAALFLQEFVNDDTPWAHFDIFGWNAATRPGRPKGGEAMAIRAAFWAISRRFA